METMSPVRTVVQMMNPSNTDCTTTVELHRAGEVPMSFLECMGKSHKADPGK